MRKFLTIAVPRYNETEKEIFPLLSSISIQAGIDFSDLEVIIANDGKEVVPLNEDFFSLFCFDIRQITCEKNLGCGPARQAAFDVAKGEYLLCCDADDVLHNAGALGALMQEAEKQAPDMLTTSWLEEIQDENGRYRYITHENDNTWMHGKLYRRHFLIQNGIRFPDFLRVQEDSYFNGLAAALAKKRIYMPVTSYIWKFNPGSTTRKNNGIYAYESVPDFIRSCSLVHEKLKDLAPEQMERKILQFVAYNYFSLHQPGWHAPEHETYRKAAETAFAEHVKPFWHYWENAPMQAIADIYNQERANSFAGCLEQETIQEWIRRLGLSESEPPASSV